MAIQSKFYQLTGQILLEYKTDQYVILRNETGNVDKDYRMYEGKDGSQYCLLDDNVESALYREYGNSTHFYAGNDSQVSHKIEEAENEAVYPYGHDIYIENSNFQIGRLICDKTHSTNRSSQMYCDTIRLYILTGYVMNSIAGYALKVKGKVTNVSCKENPEDENSNTIIKRINDYLYLLNWYMPKEELKNKIHWLDNPLYMNSKFYDRYIEIEFPSAQDIAINNRNIDYVHEYTDEDGIDHIMRGTIDKFSNIIVEFATVQQDNITYTDEFNSTSPSSFILDAVKTLSIYPESNANNFGVKLYEDIATHSIIYYPTYGDGFNIEPLNLEIMDKINYGLIPLINFSSYDTMDPNEGMDDFIEAYGGDPDNIPSKWIIVNELAVTYNYDSIYHVDEENPHTEKYTDFYTNTIDYSYKTLNDGDFFISKFVPYIKERLNMNCKSIVIQYNCHLYNRMNGTDIARQASMTIKNPYKYILTSIDTTNVINYKIVNRIEKTDIPIQPINKDQGTVKIVKEFYDVTELVANDGSENIYTQGKMTIKLNRSGSNYLIKLYQLNSDNVRVPYDLTGPWKYKLVFPSISSNTIEIFANLDNDKTNYGNGSLSFYISKDKAAAIMQVPTSERYFSLMIDNNDAENSVIYEGSVEWKV